MNKWYWFLLESKNCNIDCLEHQFSAGQANDCNNVISTMLSCSRFYLTCREEVKYESSKNDGVGG